MWHTGYFFLTLLVLTASCFSYLWYKTKHFDADSFTTISMLAVMGIAGWLPLLWEGPAYMAVFHSMLIIIMWLTYDERDGLRMMGGTLLMLLCDISYIFVPDLFPSENTWRFPADIFWWQSFLNAILFGLYVDTLRKCYSNSRQFHNSGGNGNAEGDGKNLYDAWASGEQRVSD